jgi:hypothetical protein
MPNDKMPLNIIFLNEMAAHKMTLNVMFLNEMTDDKMPLNMIFKIENDRSQNDLLTIYFS